MQITQMNFTYYMPIGSLWRTILVRVGSVLLLSAFCSSSAWAQSWADSMFAIKSHNFGNVPLLSDTQYSFVFRNTTGQDVRIASVSSSCGCADVSVPVKTIKSGEKGEIIAKVNTSGQHTKNKSATITVTFDRPSTAHVQLEVAVYIRPDIVLNPGSVNFGMVREGQKITKTVQLQYAGNPNWRLVRIDRTNKYIHATAKPLENPGNSREITYDIQITLSDKAPAGDVRDILRFITNDQNAVAIELPVSGLVMDALVAKPSPFLFGSITPGETVTKYLVLRASQPFRIRSIRCDDRRFIFSPSDQTSSVHIVAVTLTSRQENAENVARTIQVETSLEDQGRLQIPIYAHFLSAEDANFSEHYAPQWKEQILASRTSAPTGNRPRPLPSRSEDWEELPIDAKTLNRITAEEAPAELLEAEEMEGFSLDLTWGAPEGEDTREGEAAEFAEFPPSVTFDDLDAQDWVPLTESEAAFEISTSTHPETESDSDWRPRVASNTPLQRDRSLTNSVPQSPPTLSIMPKPTGRVRFGTPQKLSGTEESDSLANEVSQVTTDNAPKRIVADSSESKAKVVY